MRKENLTRRQFLAAMTAGAGTVMLGPAVGPIVSCKSGSAADPFQTVTLGKTGIRTTLLGMGTGYNAVKPFISNNEGGFGGISHPSCL